jgi:two-component system NtrC family response regulator
MPGMNGMEVLQAVKGINPEIDVVIITAYGTIETAVEAMKAGALDYITKPVEFEELLLLVERVSERRTLLKENELLREQLGQVGVTTDRIIYRSEKMSALINMAGRVAASRATVLLQGESGTGKELLARLIHQLSPRASRRIIAVNCGALHETSWRANFSAMRRGPSPERRPGGSDGSKRRTAGRSSSTRSENSPPCTVKLLRFLQEHEFQRLGGNQTLHSDVRVISATNRDLNGG